jgi:ankyrin repeat protein
MMFTGDIQGNTPLHLAALNNHFDTVNYLAFKGLEQTRLMTSDKVKVKASHTFDQLTEEVCITIIDTFIPKYTQIYRLTTLTTPIYWYRCFTSCPLRC